MKIKNWSVLIVGIIAPIFLTGTTVRLVAKEFGGGQNQLGSVLDKLREATYGSGKGVRLYYSAACDSEWSDITFPKLKLRLPLKGKTGLAAVREIFRDNKNVVIDENPRGIIKIKIGDVPDVFLRTRISILNLDEIERYNPRLVVDKIIFKSKEMLETERKLGYVPPFGIGGQVVEPAQDLPHLPASIRNATLEEILDMIATTWSRRVSIVTFAVCSPPRSGQTVSFDIGVAADLVP